jgi:pimeloyl-ACP methyl ester carboxylesterase
MAQIKAGEINLEHYIEGSGPPLLMIRGFGASAAAWNDAFLEQLRPHFTCIRFSNRGTGQSDPGAATTTIRMMADDATNLLTALGMERAHIFGVSMGGMIAQEFALAHPERVMGLVLGCTTPGGPNAATTASDVLAAITPAQGSSREEQLRAAWPAMCTPSFIAEDRDFLEEMLSESLAYPTPLETIMKQMAAIREFDTYDRLGQIAAPTLVVHGEADILIPPANGKLLHERIPGSEMTTIPNAAHMFFWEKPNEAARAIVEFLSRVPTAA